VKTKLTICVPLAAVLIVIAKNCWLNGDPLLGPVILQTPSTNAAPLEANVQPTVIVMPADLLLPPGPLPQGLTIAIAIQNNTATNLLSLSEPTINVPGVGIEIMTNEPGKSYSVMLGFPQGFVVPLLRGVAFRVKTSDPNVPEVRVPVKQMSGGPSAAPPKPAPKPAWPPGNISFATNNPAPPRSGGR
jgi:hypothetical protein